MKIYPEISLENWQRITEFTYIYVILGKSRLFGIHLHKLLLQGLEKSNNMQYLDSVHLQ